MKLSVINEPLKLFKKKKGGLEMIMRAIPYAKLCPEAKAPIRASDGAIGYDVFACRVLDRQTKMPIGKLPTIIEPGDAKLIGVGIAFAVPWRYEAQVRPRSGLASKYDIELSNSPGTVDPDFRGEVGCLLRNRGNQPFMVEPAMRIAQLIFTRVEMPEFSLVKDASLLPPTRRDTGGFGSTGFFGQGLGTEQYDQELTKVDEYFMKIVLATAEFSNCARGCLKDEKGHYQRNEKGKLINQTRKYGCVIADTENLSVIASGYNAQAPGLPLCAEVGCQRDELGIPSGEKIEICRAIHAEQMAIRSALNKGASIKGMTMYVNAEPCLFCARQIAGFAIEALVILEGGYGQTHGLKIIQKAGIKIRKISLK